MRLGGVGVWRWLLASANIGNSKEDSVFFHLWYYLQKK
jgi:hypothetical protein